MTMMSGVSPVATRRSPRSAKRVAMVDVSAKLSLHPNVWKRTLADWNAVGSIIEGCVGL